MKMKVIFRPYWILATTGFSEIKVKILRFAEYGMGMMSDTNRPISKTSSKKTYSRN